MLTAPSCRNALVQNLQKTNPTAMAQVPQLTFIEQYDYRIESGKEEDYAYVADTVFNIKLGANVDELRSEHIPYEQLAALQNIRDTLAAGEPISWYIVFCNDEVRSFSTRTSTSTPPTELFDRISNPSHLWPTVPSIKPSMATSSYSYGRPVSGEGSETPMVYDDCQLSDWITDMSIRLSVHRSGHASGPARSRSRRGECRDAHLLLAYKMLTNTSMKDLKSKNGSRSFITERGSSPVPPLPQLPGTAH